MPVSICYNNKGNNNDDDNDDNDDNNTKTTTTINYIILLLIIFVGRGGSLVDSAPFVGMVAGSNAALAATDLGQVFHSQLPSALRRETPTQYMCCVGSDS